MNRKRKVNFLSHRGVILGMVFFILTFSVSCQEMFQDPLASGNESSLYSDTPENLQVFFTQPGTSRDTGIDVGIVERMANLIRNADSTVDVCVFELSEPTIYEAIIDAHNKGVKVRFVGDIDALDYSGYQALIANQVPMKLGNPERIMHNKFTIVDGYHVIFGSANYTPTGARLNNENTIFIQSKDLAAYFKKEVDNFFINGNFGLDKEPFDGFTDNKFSIDDETEIEVYFSPYTGEHPDTYPEYANPYDDRPERQNASARIAKMADDAKHSIYFTMFAFTHPVIGEVIIRRAVEDNIQVYGIFDKSWHEMSGNVFAMHHRFFDAQGNRNNIHLVYDGNENYDPLNPYHGSKAHNKIMVVDPGTTNGQVFTGSFNFSSSAARTGNDESCMVIHSVSISRLYQEEFLRQFAQGRSPTRDVGGENLGNGNVRAVWLNEVNWAGSLSDDGTSYERDKFIELKNRLDRPINISGWTITGIQRTYQPSWRIRSYIVPEGTVIEAGGYFVVHTSYSSSAFESTANSRDYFNLFIYNKDNQNSINLALKDTHQNIIDSVGSINHIEYDFAPPVNPPPAGEQSTSGYRSMVRVDANTWRDATNRNAYVKAGFEKTFATPGSD